MLYTCYSGICPLFGIAAKDPWNNSDRPTYRAWLDRAFGDGVFVYVADVFTSILRHCFSLLAPILALPLAAIFLGETITRPIMITSFLGFAGVVMISFSQIEESNLPSASLFGIVAGLGFAITMAISRVFVKLLAKEDSAALIALSFSITAMIGGIATVPFGWATLDNSVFWLLALGGAIGGVGHITANEAVRRGDISVLGPFDYSAIVWALAIDVMIFGFEPTHLDLLGILVIVFAALSLAIKQFRSMT